MDCLGFPYHLSPFCAAMVKAPMLWWPFNRSVIIYNLRSQSVDWDGKNGHPTGTKLVSVLSKITISTSRWTAWGSWLLRSLPRMPLGGSSKVSRSAPVRWLSVRNFNQTQCGFVFSFQQAVSLRIVSVFFLFYFSCWRCWTAVENLDFGASEEGFSAERLGESKKERTQERKKKRQEKTEKKKGGKQSKASTKLGHMAMSHNQATKSF